MSQWNKAAKKRQRIFQLCEQRVKEREVHPGAGYKSVQFMVIPSEYKKLPTCMCLGWFLWNMRSGSFVYAWSVTIFVTPWTEALQAPLSMRFPMQEHWCGLPFPAQEIFLPEGLKPCLLHFLHWQANSLPLCHRGSPSISVLLFSS